MRLLRLRRLVGHAPLSTAAVAAVVLLAAACTSSDSGQAAATNTASPTTPAPAVQSPGGGAGYADVVEQVAPSVVTVETGSGVGSGVVFDSDVIVTNQHVVGDAANVTIHFADGTSTTGTVLATDVVTDIAVVRSERSDLPVPEYRTQLPRPGDVVLAIGSPLGFQGTVTAGIVSGLSREIPGSAAKTPALVDLIQTDAPISPGNSGGALLDTAGRVVGINEAYIPPATGAVSLGFAIPAATVVDVAEQLLADGTATHPYLGLTLGRLTPDLKQALGVDVDSGALVLGVQANGPGATAGVQRADVVVGLNDETITTVEDLLGALRDTQPSQPFTLTVIRDGEETTLNGTVGERPQQPE